jgi:hypothetical protein
MRGKYSKNGLTLVELLIVIMLLFIVGVATLKLTFPKKGDLQKKGPPEAVESAIRMARKIANREAKPMRIWFVDQSVNIQIDEKLNPRLNTFFPLDESNPNRKNSILDFFEETTTSPPQTWPKYSHSGLTNTPLFLVTDMDGKTVFDEDKVCYAILRNPGKDQLTKHPDHAVFEEGYLDSSSKWKKEKTGLSQYFTVYPSGLCDYVGFNFENCPEYNHDYVIDPIAGIAKQIN